MQTADDDAIRKGQTSVIGPSLALDLSWALFAASSDYLRAVHPEAGRLYAEAPGLAERVSGFWESGVHCFAEMEVLAQHADALGVKEFPALRSKLEEALFTIPRDLRLGSESDDDRALLLSRMDTLRGDHERRHQYFELISDVWSRIEPWWRKVGVPKVERTALQVRKDLERGVVWSQLISPKAELTLRHRSDIEAAEREGIPVVLAPCALFGKDLYLDLPACSLVGLGVDGAQHESRARTEDVAQRLRALADPTRLAIFDFLKSGPSTVGDVARAFNLAQPTVSVHVKRLREVGLVAAERKGANLEIAVNRANADRLATEFVTLLED